MLIPSGRPLFWLAAASALLGCLWLTGCCDNSERCGRAPEAHYMDFPIWPDLQQGTEPKPASFAGQVAAVEPGRFVIESESGDLYEVSWPIRSAGPPFSTGQAVQVSQCSSAGLNGRSAATVRAEDGRLLYAAAAGFDFGPFPCLPQEVSFYHEDSGCCANPAVEELCGEASNTGLHFKAESETTVWTGEESDLMIGTSRYRVHNLYSFKIEEISCTDTADKAAAFALALSSP